MQPIRCRLFRCPQTFGRLRLLLRGSFCNIRRRMPSHLLGAPCRTEHRSEIWAIPSLCHATPSATSERLMELLGSSPIFLSFVASCVSFQLRPLPSTRVTRLHQYCEASPPSQSARPVSRGLPVDPYRDHRWDFPCYVWSPLPACRRQYPGRTDGIYSLIRFHQASAFPRTGTGRLLHCRFRGLLSVHSRYGLHARQVA